MKKAIITGITGQDGAYLARLLLNEGYGVYGTYRRTSSENFWRLDYLNLRDNPNLHLVECDLLDLAANIRLIQEVQPHELYNLAAQSFVGVSFDQPILTGLATGIGVTNVLEAIRIAKPDTKFYQASTSEMFGKVQAIPQTEETPFYPRSPYGAAKMYGHWMTLNYRESYDIFAASGILFNHESPLRGLEFVTRKITDAVAKIKLGSAEVLELGNLNAKRDWGFADDFVEGMYKILQHHQPDTFVLATNKTYTVRHFVKSAFEAAGITLDFEGSEEDEIGREISTGKVLVRVNPKFYRPAEVDFLIGDPQKASNELGWQPKTQLDDLILMMVEADLKRHDN
jgi:GDPmannose 4,6-dehydratase